MATTRPLDEEMEHALVVAAPQELETAGAQARAIAEIQAAIIIAKKYPRNEEASFQRLMKACDRFGFADAAAYAFKRGAKKNPVTGDWEDNMVTGPAAPMVREACRIWGNSRSGLLVVHETKDTRKIRGWAWDLETNTYKEAEDEFEKLVERKVKVNGRNTNETEWVVPNERDLRELTNRRGAILVRNCQLDIMPKDYIEDALDRAQQTVEKGARTDPDAWKKIANAFGELNISVDQLFKYLHHPLQESSPKELVTLRAIWKSISDGNSTWAEYYSTSGDENLAGKSSEVLNGIKERYAKSSAGAAANGGHTESSADPQKGGVVPTQPLPLTPEEQKRKDHLQAEADRQKRQLDERQHTKKQEEAQPTQCASPEGLFGEG
jgi:hypothetical protein